MPLPLKCFALTRFSRIPPRHQTFRRVSTEYRSAMNNASRVVGHPLEDVGLLSALKDDFPLNSFARTSNSFNAAHPLVAAIRQVDRQKYGLISLLIAKLVREDGLRRARYGRGTLSDEERHEEAKVSEKTLLLAEAVEMIEGGCLMHSKVSTRELPDEFRDDVLTPSISVDKSAISNGSHLIFQRATTNMLRIGNSEVLLSINKAIQDFVEGEFLASELQSDILNTAATNFVVKAERIKALRFGSLLGNACKSMLIILGERDSMQQVALDFGRNFAMALETSSELNFYLNGHLNERIELNAPLLHAMEDQPSLLELFQEHENCSLVSSKVHEAVMNSESILKVTRLLQSYITQSIESLECFIDCESKHALLNAVVSLRVKDTF